MREVEAMGGAPAGARLRCLGCGAPVPLDAPHAPEDCDRIREHVEGMQAAARDAFEGMRREAENTRVFIDGRDVTDHDLWGHVFEGVRCTACGRDMWDAMDGKRCAPSESPR